MKKESKNITISIDTLIRNMVVVVRDEKEAPEAIAQKVSEALGKIADNAGAV